MIFQYFLNRIWFTITAKSSSYLLSFFTKTFWRRFIRLIIYVTIFSFLSEVSFGPCSCLLGLFTTRHTIHIDDDVSIWLILNVLFSFSYLAALIHFDFAQDIWNALFVLYSLNCWICGYCIINTQAQEFVPPPQCQFVYNIAIVSFQYAAHCSQDGYRHYFEQAEEWHCGKIP